MSRIGVIPAAGCATRFGGIPKELLPARDGRSFLWHAVNRVPFDRVVIITTAEKIEAHAREVGPRACFVIQREQRDLWGAILMALEFGADSYTFTMPDTLMPEDALLDVPAGQFSLGTFETENPGRYGCIVGGNVINKQPGVAVPVQAWGALHWTRSVVALWDEMQPETYTQAINMAIDSFGLHTWPLGWYHDNASIADYLEYMHK